VLSNNTVVVAVRINVATGAAATAVPQYTPVKGYAATHRCCCPKHQSELRRDGMVAAAEHDAAGGGARAWRRPPRRHSSHAATAASYSTIYETFIGLSIL
jgi:hypothetical protein